MKVSQPSSSFIVALRYRWVVGLTVPRIKIFKNARKGTH